MFLIRMKRRLFLFGAICSIAFISKAQPGLQTQPGDHLLGDWRNFAEQTQVTLQLHPFSKRPNTIGSQFLFDDWVKGTIINMNGVEFTEGLFNFNKVSQNLYVQMKDTANNVAFLVDREQLKSIALSDGVQSYLLEKVAALDPGSFYTVLSKGKKYSLYSQVTTKFIASNFETNGIVTSGNSYDEYKDELTYWVVFADGSVHELSLKKKSIKTVFDADKDKVDQFYKDNSALGQNEIFLSSLVTFLNQ